MESKNVLIITSNQYSIIMKTLQEYLTKAEYTVAFSQATIEDLSQERTTPEVVLLYAEDLDDKDDVIIFIRDICVEKGLQMGIIGHANQIEELKKKIPGGLIWDCFERPFNALDLVTTLNGYMEGKKLGLTRKHIMVVDDSEVQLRLIESWLGDKYRISTATSAAKAISELSNFIPDLILLDYEMPVCTGPQFLEMIHAEERTKNIPVIFLTAVGDIESVKVAAGLKPAGYLLKTMEPAKIKRFVDEFFEKQVI
ncbi:MAG: response regulator [Parasporobacterium sp.]|nr:response regulator [Parasporobacterium sp.]